MTASVFLGDKRKKKLTEKEFEAGVQALIADVKASVSPFPQDTPAKKEARVRRARDDQEYFNTTYLSHYFSGPPAAFHAELETMIDEGERQQRPVAAAAPRGFAKSTRVTFARTLKKALYKEKRFALLVSDTLTQAKGLTVSIRVEAEHNPRLTHDFGPQKTDQWAADDFVLASGTRIMARGDGQGVRGLKHGPHRPDLAIVDDIESDESVRNPARVKQTYDWIMSALVPTLDPERGVLFWVGTLLSKRSALAKALANEEFIRTVFRAIQADGTSLWPERFSLERLAKIKRLVGSIVFAKEYQNEPSDEDALFQEAWIKRVKTADLPAIAAVAMALDPSNGEGQSGDFKGLVTVARAGDARLVVRHAHIRRESIDRMLKTCWVLDARFKPVAFGWEKNSFALLKREFDRTAAIERRHLPLREITHSTAKEGRVGRLSPLVENGVLVFEDGADVGDMDLLLEQLLVFPDHNVNDDGPDALEMAADLVEGRTGVIEFQSAGDRRVWTGGAMGRFAGARA